MVRMNRNDPRVPFLSDKVSSSSVCQETPNGPDYDYDQDLFYDGGTNKPATEIAQQPIGNRGARGGSAGKTPTTRGKP